MRRPQYWPQSWQLRLDVGVWTPLNASGFGHIWAYTSRINTNILSYTNERILEQLRKMKAFLTNYNPCNSWRHILIHSTMSLRYEWNLFRLLASRQQYGYRDWGKSWCFYAHSDIIATQATTTSFHIFRALTVKSTSSERIGRLSNTSLHSCYRPA
jgi:hypothetical protein